MTDNQVLTVIVRETEQCNHLVAFWNRVREHQALGLVPAGQVNPPPKPRQDNPSK